MLLDACSNHTWPPCVMSKTTMPCRLCRKLKPYVQKYAKVSVCSKTSCCCHCLAGDLLTVWPEPDATIDESLLAIATGRRSLQCRLCRGLCQAAGAGRAGLWRGAAPCVRRRLLAVSTGGLLIHMCAIALRGYTCQHTLMCCHTGKGRGGASWPATQPGQGIVNGKYYTRMAWNARMLHSGGTTLQHFDSRRHNAGCGSEGPGRATDKMSSAHLRTATLRKF
jgi:hypothetical protein